MFVKNTQTGGFELTFYFQINQKDGLRFWSRCPDFGLDSLEIKKKLTYSPVKFECRYLQLLIHLFNSILHKK